MNHATRKLNLRLARKHCFLAILALICAITTIESLPEGTSTFHGLDFYTISGLHSTTEVFHTGGTYILHDHAARTPNCSACKPIEIQADYAGTTDSHVNDFFNRIVPMAEHTAEPTYSTSRDSDRYTFLLPGRAISPEPPPPRSVA